MGGVKVDKNGVGLLKVWKHQLLQLKNISPDIAQAILAVYPSPLMLRQVNWNYRDLRFQSTDLKIDIF